MTPDDFRRIALSMPESVEVYRRGRSHFRVERRAFATLEGPGDAVATVNLTPDQQSMFVHAAPKALCWFPAAGVALAAQMSCWRLLRSNFWKALSERPGETSLRNSS
jgi:hypothetical protein